MPVVFLFQSWGKTRSYSIIISCKWHTRAPQWIALVGPYHGQQFYDPSDLGLWGPAVGPAVSVAKWSGPELPLCGLLTGRGVNCIHLLNLLLTHSNPQRARLGEQCISSIHGNMLTSSGYHCCSVIISQWSICYKCSGGVNNKELYMHYQWPGRTI